VKTLLKYWIYRQTQTNKFVKWVLRTFVGWTVGVHASDGTTLNILLTVHVRHPVNILVGDHAID